MIKHAIVGIMLVFVVVMLGVAIGFNPGITAATVVEPSCDGDYQYADKGQMISSNIIYLDYSFSPDIAVFLIDDERYNVEVGEVFGHSGALICPYELSTGGMLMYSMG